MALVAGAGLDLTCKAGVAETSGDVTGWTDQITGTRQLTVPVGQSSPRIGDVSLNGNDVMSFDGLSGGSMLQLDDGQNERDPGATGNTYIYILFRAPTNGNFNYVVDGGSDFNRQAIYLRESPDEIFVRSGGNDFGVAFTTNTWMVITAKFAEGVDGCEIFIDGVSQATGDLGNLGGGTGNTIGGRGDISNEAEFDIARIVEYYDVAEHSQADIDQNVTELQESFGIGLNLVTAEQGSYIVTGQTTGLVESSIMTANQGSYTVTGQDVTISEATADNYAEATWTNPSVALTDFIGFIDLRDMPPEFWNDNNTTDATKGRITKPDGTPLPTDWVEFDNVNEKGVVWFKWTGTLATSGTQEVRIFPPFAANASYSPTHQYGRNAVWSDYETVLHLNESGNGTSGEYIDSTGNNTTGRGGNGTSVSVPSRTTVDNPWDIAWNNFDGSNDYIAIENALDSYEGTDLSVQCIFYPNQDGSDESGLVAKRVQGDDTNGYWQVTYNDDDTTLTRNLKTNYSDGTNSDSADGGTEVAASATTIPFWVGATWSSTAVELYNNGVLDGEDTTPSITPANFDNTSQPRIGQYYTITSARSTNAKIGEVRMRRDQLSGDWFSHEYDNQSDTATFWGTWTWETITPIVLAQQGSYTVTGQDIAITRNTELDQGSYTLTGQNVALITPKKIVLDDGFYQRSESTVLTFVDKFIVADQGSYTLTGNDTIFTVEQVTIFLNQGSYVLTGQDIQTDITRALVLNDGSYTYTGNPVVFDAVGAIILPSGNYTLTGYDVNAVLLGASVTLSTNRTLKIDIEPRIYYI